MAAIICPDAIYLKTSGVAADGFALLEHYGVGNPSSRKLIRGTHPRRTCSEDNHLWPTFSTASRVSPPPPAQGLFCDSDVLRLRFIGVQRVVSQIVHTAWDLGASGMSEAGADTKNSSDHERNEALGLCTVSLIAGHGFGEYLLLAYGLVNREYGDD